MRKILKFTIAEPSDILFAGLEAILRQINAAYRVFRAREPEQIRVHLQMEQPDVLMVNPVFMGGETLAKLRSETDRPDLICVALVSDLPGLRLSDEYDARILLYDGFEQIRERISALSPRQEEEREKTLSHREKEIITYVVKGFTNKQIADELCLSQHTVITHRRNIAAKLQIHSPAGLTIYAIVNKLVKLDEVKEGIKEE